MPSAPLVLHTIYAYIHIRHLCNPPSENLDYRPGVCVKVTWLLLIKYSYIVRLRPPYIQPTDHLGMGSLYPIMLALVSCLSLHHWAAKYSPMRFVNVLEQVLDLELQARTLKFRLSLHTFFSSIYEICIVRIVTQL